MRERLPQGMRIGNYLVFTCAANNADGHQMLLIPAPYYSIDEDIFSIGITWFGAYAEICFKEEKNEYRP